MKAKVLQYIVLMVGAVMMVLLTSTARAEDSETTLQQRAEARYPAIRAMKDAGRIGENAAGLVEAVDPKGIDDAGQNLVKDENTDRAELYRLIAARTNSTPDLVAQRSAERNFSHAQKGDYLKGKDGVWRRKE